MTTPEPPALAQVLLEFFVPARGRDAVIGDLLEEYQERQVPSRGVTGADWWYVRHTVGFVWRPCVAWALLISGVMIGRDFYDLALPPADFRTRATVTTYTCVSLFVLAGFAAAWRSRRALSGTTLGAIVALIVCVVESLYALTAGRMLLNSAFAAHPQAYAPLVETADIPIVPILALGILAGTVGGAIGRCFTGSSGSRAAART